MGSIVLNEKAYAEHILSNPDLGTKPSETLSRIARYYYSAGYKKNEISGLLEDFILKCDPSISVVKWQDTIDRQAKAADKFSLIDISGVAITKDEITQIKKIDGKLLQRLMFTMLCIAKYGNAVNPSNNSWVNKKDREIFSLANITVTSKRQSLMINDLWTLGYIGYSRVVDNVNLNVKIVNDNSPTELFVTDFRNLGNQYMMYCGERYVECQNCGIVVRKESNVQKYCKDCAAEMNRQKTLENWRKSTQIQ